MKQKQRTKCCNLKGIQCAVIGKIFPDEVFISDRVSNYYNKPELKPVVFLNIFRRSGTIIHCQKGCVVELNNV